MDLEGMCILLIQSIVYDMIQIHCLLCSIRVHTFQLTNNGNTISLRNAKIILLFVLNSVLSHVCFIGGAGSCERDP